MTTPLSVKIVVVTPAPVPVEEPSHTSVAVGGVNLKSRSQTPGSLVRSKANAEPAGAVGHPAITGAVTSLTVTVAWQVSTLPLTSVTVSTTALAPRSSQSNDELSIAMLAIPQASVEPPSMSAAVMEAVPVRASRSTLMF